MRKGLVCTAVVLSFVLAPMASLADDVQDQLQRMEDRMAEMEDRLQATNDQLEAANDVVSRQQQIIDRSGIADQTAGSSGVAAFLDSLEIGGWLAGSYWYNFQDPNGENLGGVNQGVTGFAYPFHPDSNSFSVDQLWFEMERPVTESQRAGFRADFCFGKICDILSSSANDDPSGEDGFSGSANDFNLYQAYIQYLAPISEGVTFKFGKFGTLMGAEVAPTVYNFNVTRGNVYNMLQPVTQVGILAEMEFGDGFHGALGVVNENVTDNDVDLNNDKSVIGQLGWAGETVGVKLNGSYGSTNGALVSFLPASVQGALPSSVFAPCVPSSTFPFSICSLEADKETIADMVVTWDPTPEFSAWLNGTYREIELSQTKNAVNFVNPDAANPFGNSVSAWGVAVAGRYALSEKLGVALRGEYLDDQDSFFSGLALASACAPPSCAAGNKGTELYSVTGTVDYSLTEQLVVRGEVRYDQAKVERRNDKVFWGNKQSTPGTNDQLEDDQITAGVEVIYNF